MGEEIDGNMILAQALKDQVNTASNRQFKKIAQFLLPKPKFKFFIS